MLHFKIYIFISHFILAMYIAQAAQHLFFCQVATVVQVAIETTVIVAN